MRKYNSAFFIMLTVIFLQCSIKDNNNIFYPELLALKEHKIIYSIGIYRGISPFQFEDLPEIKNPVLTAKDITDVTAAFIADPFIVNEKENWYMFFEVMNAFTHTTSIGLAVSKNGLKWTYDRIVLKTNFIISYPYVFKYDGNYYMIPESLAAQAVKLYKAADFPYKWEFVKDLICGQLTDASIFYFDNNWWIFAEGNPHNNSILRLFYADNLFGNWTEHPKSPIINGNSNIARPGGRVTYYDDKIIRYTQDDHPEYGIMVRAFIINELTLTTYSEEEYGVILAPSGNGWNANGMHHIDPHQINEKLWIACVDGWQRVSN
ncbi:hypothetical protein ACFL4T_04215 [candidate division KSB1 bacterium]